MNEKPMHRDVHPFTEWMDVKLANLLKRVETSEPYRRIFHPDADPKFVRAAAKCLMLEIFSYSSHVTEATFTAIGRMPKNRPDLIRILVRHVVEEMNHGEPALVDFAKLGGNEQGARQRRIAPAAFALAATVRMLAERESPFASLGFLYHFAALTPILNHKLREQLARNGSPNVIRKSIDVRVDKGLPHGRGLRDLIGRIAVEFAEAPAEIEYGFDCFGAVHPLPVWDAALRHALSELGGY